MVEILLGHLVGDYLLQDEWMALNKKRPGAYGALACALHCGLWTSSVVLFTGEYMLAPVIFLSHWVLDRDYFVKWYMEKVGIFTGPKTWVEFAVVDNTFHLVMLYMIFKFLA